MAGLQNRFDRQTVDTMLYYRNLFLPVFECGNVCLAIPNFSQRFYFFFLSFPFLFSFFFPFISLSIPPFQQTSLHRRLEELIDEEIGGNEDDEEDIEVEEVVRGTLDKWRNECESKLGIRLAGCRFFESWTTNGIRKRESKKFIDGTSSRYFFIFILFYFIFWIFYFLFYFILYIIFICYYIYIIYPLNKLKNLEITIIIIIPFPPPTPLLLSSSLPERLTECPSNLETYF